MTSDVLGRAWYSDHYCDHPLFNPANKLHEVYTDDAYKRWKVYCDGCFLARKKQLTDEDLEALQYQRIAQVQDIETIQSQSAL